MSVGTFDFLLGSPLFAQDRKPGATSNPGQFQNVETWGGYDPGRDLKFTHLNTKDGLSQDDVLAIYQDHRGFLWFATGEGLNRYDGKTFVVYKNNPEDLGTLSHNFIRDLVEDDHGYLWVAAHPGVNKFDPRTERSVRYVPNPHNSNSLGSDAVWRITRDSHGYLWFAEDTGLDRFDPATETFTHYRNDTNGEFVGRITHVLEDSQEEIWFVGELGLFHLDVKTGRISRAPRPYCSKLYLRRQGRRFLAVGSFPDGRTGEVRPAGTTTHHIPIWSGRCRTGKYNASQRWREWVLGSFESGAVLFRPAQRTFHTPLSTRCNEPGQPER